MHVVKKISVDTVENYKWDNGCDGWHFLKTDELSVIREKMRPYTAEQAHYHNCSQQLFYILSGSAHFEIANETIELNMGEAIHVPPKTPHKISNISGDDLQIFSSIVAKVAWR